MNSKTMFGLLASVGLLVLSLSQSARAWNDSPGGGKDVLFCSAVVASSATVFSGSGILFAIDLSSGNGNDYAVAYDSVVVAGISAYPSQFADSGRLTPAIVFSSATTVVSNQVPNVGQGGNGWRSPGGMGVRFQNALFIYKSAGRSGEANIAHVYWRR